MRESRTSSKRRSVALIAAVGIPGLALLALGGSVVAHASRWVPRAVGIEGAAAVQPTPALPAHLALVADAPPPGAAPGAPARADPGYAITNPLVVENCSSCHRQDAAGYMGRISYLRKTPEGWQASIQRMVSLHGAKVAPDAAREIVRYLSNAQGLAPEELQPARFEVERRQIPFRYADVTTERTCAVCHTMGRIITQRRTSEEWDLLIQTHRGLYPLIDNQVFLARGEPQRSESNPQGKHPVELAIDHLSRAFPLETSEWRAWAANARAPRLAGTWALSGSEPGRGRIYGTVEIRPVPGSEDEFTTEARYVYASDGTAATRSGRSLVYTGYQWRGRSTGSRASEPLREVMTVARGWESIDGRWFNGGYDELGIDVTLRRVTGSPVVTGVEPGALRAGAGAQRVRLYGANLPSNLAASAVDLGPGVTVRRVVESSPERVTVEVEVAADAQVGRRDAHVGGTSLGGALAVYDRIDGIRIVPEVGLARVGGIVAPRQMQQFEAIAYQRGADGRFGTDDDLELGPVQVQWSLEEYPVTYDDDDIHFVGRLDEKGLFTPNLDGPNPERSGNRNNIGEVWVVATYRDPAAGQSDPLQARSYLIVTAPLHLRWGDTAQ